MTRLSTSRPKRSVPSGCSQVPRSVHAGAISFCVMSAAIRSRGARTGARTAVSASAVRTEPANQGNCLRGAMADPRVEITVEKVHEQVADQVEGAEYQHAGLHDGIVTRRDALEDQAPETRPGEH